MVEKLPILLVEDNDDDISLLKRAFLKAGIDAPVHSCSDGAEAIEYLHGEGNYSDRNKFPFPRVLITDLKMPRCSGFDLLQWLDQHPDCSVIPTIVLTSSREEKDVKKAFELGANCYFQKPSTFTELCELVRLSHEFWSRSILPAIPNGC